MPPLLEARVVVRRVRVYDVRALWEARAGLRAITTRLPITFDVTQRPRSVAVVLYIVIYGAA